MKTFENNNLLKIGDKNIGQNLQYVSKWHTMVTKIIDMVFNEGGYIYGGYVRDLLAKTMFHDIDIRFYTENILNHFITELAKIYKIEILHTSYAGCKSILVSNPEILEYGVFLDLTYTKSEKNSRERIMSMTIDFDVNALLLQREGYGLINALLLCRERHGLNCYCNYRQIINNCYNKKFIVLDSQSNPNIVHKERYQCIYRDTIDGKKKLERIKKMQSRGWTCLNEFCRNPLCILASEETIRKYNIRMVIEKNLCHKQMLIAQQNHEQKLAILRKSRKASALYFAIHYPQSMPTPITIKEGNIISYEHKYKSKKKESAKKFLSEGKKKQTNALSAREKKNLHRKKRNDNDINYFYE